MSRSEVELSLEDAVHGFFSPGCLTVSDHRCGLGVTSVERQIDQGQLQRLIQILSRFLASAAKTAVQAELFGMGTELEAEQNLSADASYVLVRLWRLLGLHEALGRSLAEHGEAAQEAVYLSMARLGCRWRMSGSRSAGGNLEA